MVDDRTIRTQIEIKADPTRVFDAWTDPRQLLAWWGDDAMYRGIRWEIDLRTGGSWFCEGRSADGNTYVVQGEYIVVDRPRRLSFTWAPDWDAPHITTVSLEFVAVPSGTLLRLSHSGFVSDQARESHENGWARVLAWLQTYVEPPTHDAVSS